jgi:hypothetical protein
MQVLFNVLMLTENFFSSNLALSQALAILRLAHSPLYISFQSLTATSASWIIRLVRAYLSLCIVVCKPWHTAYQSGWRRDYGYMQEQIMAVIMVVYILSILITIDTTSALVTYTVT